MFEKKAQIKTEGELIQIANNPRDYQSAFLAAILKEIKHRGIAVDTSELEALVQKEKEMKEERENRWIIPDDLHPNLKLASNLIFVSLILGIINKYFISSSIGFAGVNSEVVPFLIGLALTAVIGYLIRLGMLRIRILLLIFFLIGLIPTVALSQFLFENNLVAGVLSLLQVLIQFYVLILLYKKSTTEWYNLKKARANKVQPSA